MASQNPNQRNSLYPQVIDSNLDAPSQYFHTNHSSSSQPNLYPTIEVVENLFCDDITAGSPTAPPEATEEVLIKIPGAILNLIDKQYSVELASGDLTVIRLSQGDNTIAVYARVADEIQWPLAKDETAVKLDDSHYFFSFRAPNGSGSDSDEDESDGRKKDLSDSDLLSYGLTIASKGQEHLLKELDAILQNSSSFSIQKVSEKAKKKGEVLDGSVAKEVSPKDLESSKKKKEMMEGQCAAYWTTLAPNVEDYSGSTARLIAAGSGHVIKGILWCGDVTMERLQWGNQIMKKRLSPGEHAEINPQTLKRIRRVKRVTKMTEKVATGLLSGVVKVSGFFTSSVVNSKVGKKFFSFLPGEVVLASLDGFSKVCDAVEVAGKNVMSTSSTVTTELVDHRSESGNLHTADMENKLLKQHVKGLMLLVMLWAQHGLHLRLGRLLTLRVFLNLLRWPNLVLKLQLLILKLKNPSKLRQEFFSFGSGNLQSKAAAFGFTLPTFSLRKGGGT